MTQSDRLRAARAALDKNDLSAAATLLDAVRANLSNDEPLLYNRTYLQLFHELDLKARRAARGTVAHA